MASYYIKAIQFFFFIINVFIHFLFYQFETRFLCYFPWWCIRIENSCYYFRLAILSKKNWTYAFIASVIYPFSHIRYCIVGYAISNTFCFSRSCRKSNLPAAYLHKILCNLHCQDLLPLQLPYLLHHSWYQYRLLSMNSRQGNCSHNNCLCLGTADCTDNLPLSVHRRQRFAVSGL